MLQWYKNNIDKLDESPFKVFIKSWHNNNKSDFELLDKIRPNLEEDSYKLYNKDKLINLLLKECEASTQCSGFTFTLKKKFHDEDPIYIHRLVIDKINRSTIWKDKRYILIGEFTKKGIIHYHGIMLDEYQREVIRCTNWWRRNFGFAKPELKINSRKSWITYMYKDYGKSGLWTITQKMFLKGNI